MHNAGWKLNTSPTKLDLCSKPWKFQWCNKENFQYRTAYLTFFSFFEFNLILRPLFIVGEKYLKVISGVDGFSIFTFLRSNRKDNWLEPINQFRFKSVDLVYTKLIRLCLDLKLESQEREAPTSCYPSKITNTTIVINTFYKLLYTFKFAIKKY